MNHDAPCGVRGVGNRRGVHDAVGSLCIRYAAGDILDNEVIKASLANGGSMICGVRVGMPAIKWRHGIQETEDTTHIMKVLLEKRVDIFSDRSYNTYITDRK